MIFLTIFRPLTKKTCSLFTSIFEPRMAAGLQTAAIATSPTWKSSSSASGRGLCWRRWGKKVSCDSCAWESFVRVFCSLLDFPKSQQPKPIRKNQRFWGPQSIFFWLVNYLFLFPLVLGDGWVVGSKTRYLGFWLTIERMAKNYFCCLNPWREDRSVVPLKTFKTQLHFSPGLSFGSLVSLVNSIGHG